MNILPKRSFIIPRIAQPPIVCIQNIAIDVPEELAEPFLADGSAVATPVSQPTPTRRQREKAVIG
jgi:hypothetical protein